MHPVSTATWRGVALAAFVALIKLGYDLMDANLDLRYIAGDVLVVFASTVVARVLEGGGDALRDRAAARRGPPYDDSGGGQ